MGVGNEARFTGKYSQAFKVADNVPDLNKQFGEQGFQEGIKISFLLEMHNNLPSSGAWVA